MSPPDSPRVSVGLPVYDGERYLRASIDSILAQSDPDFELIISDNASTDGTEAICREAAERDPRVRYERQPTNRGGFWNHYHVMQLARGEYFMWAAHDDVRGPDCLAACRAVLDARPEVVLCYTATQSIDEEGRPLEAEEVRVGFDLPEAHERFRELSRMDHRLEPIYGLMRLEVLHRTPMQGQYADSDRVLLAELALHGPFHRVPETHFQRRDHVARSIRAHAVRQDRASWIHPDGSVRVTFPYFRQLAEYWKAIGRAAPTSRQRLHGYGHMLGWILRQRRQLAGDVDYAVRFLLRPVKRRLRGPRDAGD